MRIVRDLDQLAPGSLERPAVTLGVFDGVHRGHRRILAALALAAERLGGERVVVTFDRHPRGVIAGGAAPALITSLEHRLTLFERAGVDATIVLRFDADLARLSAERFVREVLVERIGARAIVLGRDAHFGRGRAGDLALLERLSGALGFELSAVDLLAGPDADRSVSSTAIRAAIREGRLDAAKAMLGRPVSLLGRVVRGDARGRQLGFPTANLELTHELTPPRGVYAGSVEVDGVVYPSMQNLGLRPTVAGAAEGAEGAAERLEVHLIGFEGDLYGRTLEVEMARRLRDETRFPSLAALEAQLAIDREAALRL